MPDTPHARAPAPLGRLVGTAAGLGVLVGLAWYLVAPTPEYRVTGGGLYLTSNQPSEFIAMDGWFGVLGVVAGLILGVLAVRWRRTDVQSLLVLALGGLAGAALAWRLGHALGPGVPQAGGVRTVGEVVHGQLDLEATGVLAAWPIASLVVVLVVLGWRRPADTDWSRADG